MAVEAPPSDNLYITDLPADFDDVQLTKVFGAYGVITQSKVLTSSNGGGKKAILIRYQTVDEAQWIVENLNGNIPQGLTEPVNVRYADTPETKAARQSQFFAGGGYGKAQGKGSGIRAAPYSMPSAWGSDAGKGWGKDSGKGWGKDGGKSWGKDGKGTTTIKVLYNGLLAANALPGGSGYSNDENALYIANLPGDTSDLELYKIFAPFGAIAPRGVRAMINPDGVCRGIGFVNYLENASAETAIATLNGTIMPDGRTLIVKNKGPSGAGKGEKGGAGLEA